MKFLLLSVFLVGYTQAFTPNHVHHHPFSVLTRWTSSSSFTAVFQSSRTSPETLSKVEISADLPITSDKEGSASPSEILINSIQGDAASIEEAKSTTVDASSSSEEYKKGIAIISFITLLNASLAPVWHTVFAGGAGPPPLFLNAIVSVTALVGLLAFGPFLDGKVETTSALAAKNEQAWSAKSFRGGMELGFWKGLGTTCHIYGMALTTANHGAFLLQMTTLIVPVVQGLRGAEKIPRQIQWAVILALVGITAFTQDPSGAASMTSIDETKMHIGDALVLAAAAFYSAYDIQTFYWGREVPRNELVTIKIGFQAVLSIVLCVVASSGDVIQYLESEPNWLIVVPTILWSGLIVNALATFLQVGGMQSVGPTRAQTIFASQPLWASMMNFAFLGETMGLQGVLGGGSFLGALFLAATAEAPPPLATTTEEKEM